MGDSITVLHRGIDRLVRRFQSNPFNFLSEIDLQVKLFALLVEEFSDETIPMNGGYWSHPA
jgi:hypothetical protein